MRKLPETTPGRGEETYNFLVAEPKGFDPGGKLDLAGAKHVLELRRKYGPQGKPDSRHRPLHRRELFRAGGEITFSPVNCIAVTFPPF